MPDAFDPYFKWLGIPKADQPPHAYRLLGIELFESDTDVISNAVDGRMAQVKNFQTGKFSAASQKLLNEIAAAKVCLLRPEKKAEYDERLRAYLQKQDNAAAAQVKEAVVVKAVATSEESDGGLSFLDDADVPKRNTVRAAVRRRKSGWPIPVVAGLGSLAVVAGAVAYVLLMGDGKDRPPKSQSAMLGDSARAVKTNPAAAATGDNPKPTSTRPHAINTGGVSAPRPTAGAPSTPKPKENHGPEPRLVPNPETSAPDEEPGKTAPDSTNTGEPDDDSVMVQPPPTKEPPAKKSPLPQPAQFQAMKTKIVGIFHKEFAEAKTAEAKLALAAKLDAQGDASQGDPAERYALWRMAAETACEAGDVSSAIDVANKIQAQFDGDAESIKAELLAAASRAAMTPAAAHSFCETAMKLAVAAVGRDDYDAASRYAKLATGAARRVKDPQFNHELVVHEREIEKLKTRYAAVEKAMQTLSARADDPAANLTVGNWRCFYKGDWEAGLPCLAKCGRPELAALAKRDMAKPADARERVAIADEWWKLADKEHDFKAVYRARAVYWYKQAAPSLSGLEKVRVEKLLETAAQSSAGEARTADSGPKSFGPRGALQKGNVALFSNGARVSGMRGKKMIDPPDRDPTTSTPVPAECIVSLDKVYQLRQIRFKLQVNRSAAYKLFTSRDGRKFDLLQDYSDRQMENWQEFHFPPRPVQFIKITSTGPNADLCIDCFEAYCYPISLNGAQQPGARRQ